MSGCPRGRTQLVYAGGNSSEAGIGRKPGGNPGGAAGHYSEAEKKAIGLDSYSERGATRTRANKSLFVRAFFPDGYNAREAAMERLFSACTGYLGCRAVRGMCFVDFEDIRGATNAMLK